MFCQAKDPRFVLKKTNMKLSISLHQMHIHNAMESSTRGISTHSGSKLITEIKLILMWYSCINIRLLMSK